MIIKCAIRSIYVLLIGAILTTAVVTGCSFSKGSDVFPSQIKTFQDLASAGIKISIGDPELAPAGKYAMKVLENLAKKDENLKRKIEKNIVAREPNVRAVLDKVVNKEVDAGFVYITDAMMEKDRVKIIDIPDDVRVVPEYGICVLKQSDDPKLAQDFLKFVLSKTGQDAIKNYGFVPAVKDPRNFEPEKFPGKTLVVFAAASLTDTFSEIGKSFEVKTGAKVRFHFGASDTLRQKIEQGAVGGEGGADVFAAAEMGDVQTLKGESLAGDVAPFAKNSLVVVTQK